MLPLLSMLSTYSPFNLFGQASARTLSRLAYFIIRQLHHHRLQGSSRPFAFALQGRLCVEVLSPGCLGINQQSPAAPASCFGSAVACGIACMRRHRYWGAQSGNCLPSKLAKFSAGTNKAFPQNFKSSSDTNCTAITQLYLQADLVSTRQWILFSQVSLHWLTGFQKKVSCSAPLYAVHGRTICARQPSFNADCCCGSGPYSRYYSNFP